MGYHSENILTTRGAWNKLLVRLWRIKEKMGPGNRIWIPQAQVSHIGFENTESNNNMLYNLLKEVPKIKSA